MKIISNKRRQFRLVFSDAPQKQHQLFVKSLNIRKIIVSRHLVFYKFPKSLNRIQIRRKRRQIQKLNLFGFNDSSRQKERKSLTAFSVFYPAV